MDEVKVLTPHCRKIRKIYTLCWHKEAKERGFKNEYKMLIYYYWEKMMSANVMARCLDSTQFTILNRLKKFKIKRRPVGGTNHVKRKEKKLMENYEELEGKKVRYIQSDGEVFDCIVSGIDPDIGLSIQEEKTGDYMVCLNGPLSPVVKDKSSEGYKEAFDAAVAGIRKGTLHVRDIIDATSDTARPAIREKVSSTKCAFSQ